jgi:predicted acylesterase/phospholipase RssA/CRP-like cAMP-binding protein
LNLSDVKIKDIVEKYFDIEIEKNSTILDELEIVDLAGGEWLFKQGDPGDSLYLLVRGRLQVWIEGDAGMSNTTAVKSHENITDNNADSNSNSTRDQAPDHLLGEIIPGDSVGEISLFTNEQRSAGIKAIRDSLLVKVSQSAFQNLGHQHPALVLRLAGSIATVLQKRTSETVPAARNLNTVTIVPLDNSVRVNEFCQYIAKEMRQYGSTLSLTANNLGEMGAPVDRLATDEPVSEALRNWLHDQEDEHRFVIYQCPTAATGWTDFAMRQSDIVVFVADALAESRPGQVELSLNQRNRSSSARRVLVLLQPEASIPIKNTAQWLADRDIDFHLHVRADKPDDNSRVARIISGNALGLVLAGGAARGLAHLGVYKAMEELGIAADWIGGCSIGAVMGAVIANDWGFDKAVTVGRAAFVGGKPFSDYTIPVMSLIRGRRMERLLKQHLDQQIEDLPIPFFCVSCNLDKGSLNTHQSGSLPSVLRASAALPGIIPPTVFNNSLTIDGSVLNNLPVDIMRLKPVGQVIAVDLASNKSHVIEYEKLPSPWAILRGRYLPFVRRYRLPGLMTLMLKATEMGTLGRVRQLGSEADLLLNPPVRAFGMTEVKSFDQIVNAGYQYAESELKCWLGDRKVDYQAGIK